MQWHTSGSKPSKCSWVGLFGTSAPFHRPAVQISRNLDAGVLLYSRFHESSTCGRVHKS